MLVEPLHYKKYTFYSLSTLQYSSRNITEQLFVV